MYFQKRESKRERWCECDQTFAASSLATLHPSVASCREALASSRLFFNPAASACAAWSSAPSCPASARACFRVSRSIRGREGRQRERERERERARERARKRERKRGTERGRPPCTERGRPPCTSQGKLGTTPANTPVRFCTQKL